LRPSLTGQEQTHERKPHQVAGSGRADGACLVTAKPHDLPSEPRAMVELAIASAVL